MTTKRRHKAYRPKPITADTMTLAKHWACKAEPDSLKELAQSQQRALDALRRGVGTEYQHSILLGVVSVATQIEKAGVVRGLAGVISAGTKALFDIRQRATVNGDWAAPTLYAHEITELAELVRMHTFQCEQLSRKELLAAIDCAVADTKRNGDRLAVETDEETA